MKSAVIALVAAVLILGGTIIATHKPRNSLQANIAPLPEAIQLPPSSGPIVTTSTNKLLAMVSASTTNQDPSAPNYVGQPLMINGYVVQDPTARLALSYVGTDSEADQYWSQAINNPNLPAEERKDLIEDLNQDGLSNPEHPTAQDMPIIINRIQLIEEMAQNAMDQGNADAFAEAYRDLVGMLNVQQQAAQTSQ
jgi:hypothetical protein